MYTLAVLRPRTAQRQRPTARRGKGMACRRARRAIRQLRGGTVGAAVYSCRGKRPRVSILSSPSSDTKPGRRSASLCGAQSFPVWPWLAHRTPSPRPDPAPRAHQRFRHDGRDTVHPGRACRDRHGGRSAAVETARRHAVQPWLRRGGVPSHPRARRDSTPADTPSPVAKASFFVFARDPVLIFFFSCSLSFLCRSICVSCLTSRISSPPNAAAALPSLPPAPATIAAATAPWRPQQDGIVNAQQCQAICNSPKYPQCTFLYFRDQAPGQLHW